MYKIGQKIIFNGLIGIIKQVKPRFLISFNGEEKQFSDNFMPEIINDNEDKNLIFLKRTLSKHKDFNLGGYELTNDINVIQKIINIEKLVYILHKYNLDFFIGKNSLNDKILIFFSFGEYSIENTSTIDYDYYEEILKESKINNLSKLVKRWPNPWHPEYERYDQIRFDATKKIIDILRDLFFDFKGVFKNVNLINFSTIPGNNKLFEDIILLDGYINFPIIRNENKTKQISCQSFIESFNNASVSYSEDIFNLDNIQILLDDFLGYGGTMIRLNDLLSKKLDIFPIFIFLATDRHFIEYDTNIKDVVYEDLLGDIPY